MSTYSKRESIFMIYQTGKKEEWVFIGRHMKWTDIIPLAGEADKASGNRLKVNLDLPMRDQYRDFI